MSINIKIKLFKKYRNKILISIEGDPIMILYRFTVVTTKHIL